MSVTPVISKPSILHRSLKLFPTNFKVIKGALELDPRELRRKAPSVHRNKSPVGTTAGIVIATGATIGKSSCGYPLNIALQNDASLEVLELLVRGAPEVITCRDGVDESGSLHIVLRRNPANTPQILHMFIKANPLSLHMTDRRQNTPLHVAVARRASLQVVRALYLLYPPAILQTNLNGETPLQVAQRSNLCEEDVYNFIQDAYHEAILKENEKARKA